MDATKTSRITFSYPLEWDDKMVLLMKVYGCLSKQELIRNLLAGILEHKQILPSEAKE